MKISHKEYFSFYSHALGAAWALVGTVILVVLSRHSATLMAVSLVYGVSVTILFLFSSIYHAKKTEEDGNSIWRRMDHLAIFIMIAGTYTPMCYIYLEGAWCWGIIIAQWSLVLLGTFFKLFYIQAPRYFSTIIYLAMGWMAVLAIGKLVHTMNALELAGLFAGGGFFTIGAVVYMLKKPDLLPDRMGFHGIFHIFILLGGLTHFMVVLYGLVNLVNA